MGEIADALRRAERAHPTPDSPRPGSPLSFPTPSETSEPEGEDSSTALLDLRGRRVDGEPDGGPRAVAPAGDDAAEGRSSVEDPEPRRWQLTPDPGSRSLHTRSVELRREAGKERSVARDTLRDPDGMTAQQYRRLAFRIRDSADKRSARSIVVTSAQPLDGKTTTACSLAIQLARLDQDLGVVLVDLDLRRATIAPTFGIQVDHSIEDVLRGDVPLEDAVCQTDLAGLSVLVQGHPAPDPEWLLSRPELRQLIRDLESRFDFVVIDTPPVLATSDAQLILRHAASGIFIARAGHTPVKGIRRAMEHMPTQKILGTVLNASAKAHGLSAYPYYSYGPHRPDPAAVGDEIESRNAARGMDESEERANEH